MRRADVPDHAAEQFNWSRFDRFRAADALAFVRFFTSPTTFQYFDLGGMVELMPGDVTEKSEFNVVERKTFEKLLTAARARESVMGKNEFEVKRTVVLDQKVYEIIETVRADGLYTLVAKRELLDDATKIGVMHSATSSAIPVPSIHPPARRDALTRVGRVSRRLRWQKHESSK